MKFVAPGVATALSAKRRIPNPNDLKPGESRVNQNRMVSLWRTGSEIIHCHELVCHTPPQLSAPGTLVEDKWDELPEISSERDFNARAV
jgi:hypothetical protein